MEQHRCYGCMALVSEQICPHCGSPGDLKNERHQLPVGTVLRDQYLIGRALGQGGFGITYLGWDRNLNMEVAVKEFYPASVVNRDSSATNLIRVNTASMDAAYAASLDRFLREAQALAKLRNIPEIVGIHSCFRENGTAYIAMEYVRGRELKDYVAMRGGRLSIGETLRLLEPVVDALAQVHRQGFVHRDISPDNIMLHPRFGAKLLDFGAVREVENPEAGVDLTHSTNTVVKLGFAPPEQYRNRGGIGPWTDEYALCGTIYYCLTGKLPPDAMTRSLYGEHPDWAGIPDLPPSQRAALEKGMSLQSQDRYADILAFKAALYPAQAAIPVPDASARISETAPQMATVQSQQMKTEPQGNAPVPKNIHRPPEPVVNSAPREDKPPKKESPPAGKRNLPKWLLPAAAALAIFAAAAFLFSRPQLQEVGHRKEDQKPNSSTILASAPETTMETEATPEPWKDNLLCQDPFQYLSELGLLKGLVVAVRFLDTVEDAPANAIDVSYDKIGSVLMWNDDKTVYVGAEGGINAKYACRDLFRPSISADGESIPGMAFESLKTIDFGDSFHTNYVVDMSSMFYFCGELKTLDLSNFDTSNVTDMGRMFSFCRELTTLDLSNFDTSNVTDMGYMFCFCEELKTLDVSNFDTSNVTDMDSMFYYCRELTTLDVSNFDTSNVTDMGSMFHCCEELTTLDVSNFDTSNVTDMGYMFYSCYGLTTLDVSEFDTSNVTDVMSMFNRCDNLSLTGLEELDFSNVTSYRCYDFLPDGWTLPDGRSWTVLFEN